MGSTILAMALLLAAGTWSDAEALEAEDLDLWVEDEAFPKTEVVLPAEIDSAHMASEGAPLAHTTPYRGFCTRDSQPYVEARTKLTEVSDLVESLRPGDALHAFRRGYEELTWSPCLRGLGELRGDLQDSSVPALKAWWAAGGERWIRSQLEGGPNPRYVTLPPDYPSFIGTGRGGVMSPMRCTSTETCDEGVTWRQRADAALNAEDRACPTPPSARDCEVNRARPLHRRYDEWLECVSGRTGKRVELPLDALRPPTEGWLRFGAFDPQRSCATVGVYSLATGHAWFIDGCTEGTERTGTVPLEPLRDLALLLAIQNHVQLSARPRSYEVALPADLQAAWVDGEIVGGVIGCGVGGYGSPPPHYGWRVSAGGSEVAGRLLEPSGCDPVHRTLLRLAATVFSELQTGCFSGPTPPPSTWAPLPESRMFREIQQVEQRDAQRFPALVRQLNSRCSRTDR